MVNGAHAAATALVERDLVTTPTKEKDLAATIGEATAAAATLIAFAVVEQQQNGRLDLITRNEGAARVARVAKLQLDNFGKLDFAAVAHREGKTVLRRYLDADFYQRHSAAAGEAALDRYIADVLVIVDKVVALERAMAN